MLLLVKEIRLAARMLAARPGWTAAGVLCLAIATGANTAAFTVVNGLLLRPLPFDDPGRLVMVALRDPAQGSPRPFALHEYRELASLSGETIQLLARTFFPLSLSAADGARMAQAELVSGSYFETLHVSPFLGRFFDDAADRAGTPPPIVLSHRLWRVRFGSDPGIVGSTVRVNGGPATVVAIAPPDFSGAMQLIVSDAWLPAAMYPDLAQSPAAADVPMFGVMGRLASGVTPDEAEARLTALSAAVMPRVAGRATPKVMVTAASGFGVPIALQGTVLTLSALIYVMMALLMIVACANVAALVLARGASRTREMAIRLSLGASRWRITRQLLVESAALALIGCGAGSVIAVWMTQALVARVTTPFQYVSYAVDVHPDVRVFVYAALATAAAAILCGIAPIRVAWRVDVIDVLKRSVGGGSRRSMRTLSTMVVMQFSVSTTLLIVGGVLLRTYLGAQAPHPAVDTAQIVLSTLDLDQVQADRPTGVGLYQAAMDRLAVLPGVADVGLARAAPFAPAATVKVLPNREGGSALSREPVAAVPNAVSSRYFTTMGLAIRDGRTFTDHESASSREAVVDEALARRLWPDAPAVGQTFRIDSMEGQPFQVIGVVANLDSGTPGRPPSGAFYQPFRSGYAPRMTIVVRVQGAAERVLPDVRRTIREVNADLSVVDLRTLDDSLEVRARLKRIPAAVLMVVGCLGLLLSAVGLYGVVAYGVRERARELGIRLALGARPADVRRLVLRQGFTTVAIGFALGSLATAAAAPVLRRFVFGVGSIEPGIVLTVCGVLLAVGLAALYLPAQWASSIEPASTLRGE